ncbi:serine hydrolase domain-containing protein [Algoriphagus namhaensis]|uniref:Serine hydrolase domain-containing protein n=1 Tax=Algoriphagus namhaensis TaxID=915353 RepID=A0ABV8AQC8_9BACT
MKKNFFSVLLILFAFSGNPEKTPDLSTNELDQLHESLDSLFRTEIRPNDPGAAVLVSYDGEMIVGKGYGLRDLESPTPITPHTNFRMASVSKQFTALAILTLVDEGKLSLEDSLIDFWPYSVFEGITVQHLLNHTSGLADFEQVFLTEWDRSIIVENKHVLEWLQTNPKASFAPGKGYEYSNTAYILLALLVEKVSGEEFSAYAKKNVFEKMGMEETNFVNLAYPISIKERAICYERDSLSSWEKMDGFFMNGIMGDGAVYTSIMDYFHYDNALRNNSFLSKKTSDLIFKPSSIVIDKNSNTGNLMKRILGSEDTKISYAMGWFVEENLMVHGGSWFGARTTVLREKNRPLTIAIFRNSDSSVNDLVIGTYDLVNHYLKKNSR